MASDVTENIFDACHWLTEKKEGKSSNGKHQKMFQMTSDGATRFGVTKPLARCLSNFLISRLAPFLSLSQYIFYCWNVHLVAITSFNAKISLLLCNTYRGRGMNVKICFCFVEFSLIFLGWSFSFPMTPSRQGPSKKVLDHCTVKANPVFKETNFAVISV